MSQEEKAQAEIIQFMVAEFHFFFSLRVLNTGSLSHCHGLSGHLNAPLLMLLVPPVLFLLQVKMSAVKLAY